MNDIELLELAAKACSCASKLQNGDWNPLKNKSDCFDMETELKLETMYSRDCYVWVIGGVVSHEYRASIARDKDRQRASTIAAAEIGRKML